MHTLIVVTEWVGMVLAGIAVAAALVVGTLSWLLNHPTD